jgi:hypothetical protein
VSDGDDRDFDEADGADGADEADGDVPILCRRCGDALLDLAEHDDGLQGWCDACQEWTEPSAEPDEWDPDGELEYDIADLDHARRVRLTALLDEEGTPFVWDPEHRLVVASDDEDDVDAALDAVGADPDVAFGGDGARPVLGRPPFGANGVGRRDESVAVEGREDLDAVDDEDDDFLDDELDEELDDELDDGDVEEWEETPVDDDTAEEIADALEDLAVVVRQVRRDPRADVDAGTVSQAYSLIAGSAAPYGFTDQHWSEVIAATAGLARALASGKPADRQVAATRLQRVLPGA